MAFKDVTNEASGGGRSYTEGDAIKTAKIDVGAEIVGFVLEKRDKNDPHPDKKDLVIQLEDGTKKLVFTSGNLSYKAGDDKTIKLGVLTRITRLADVKKTSKATGKSYTETQFKIEQDEDVTVDDASFNEVFVSTPTPEDRKASTQAAVEASLQRGGVAARAAELARNASAKKSASK